MNLYEVVFNWQKLGFFDIVLPFLLIFAICFAVLQKVQLFGDKAKNINVIVALVIAFLFLQNTYLIFILQRLLPNVAIILVILLLFLLLLGVFGISPRAEGKYTKYAFWISLLAILVALLSDFAPGANVFIPLYATLSNVIPIAPDLIFLIVIIVVAVLITRSSESGASKP